MRQHELLPTAEAGQDKENLQNTRRKSIKKKV